MERIKGFQFTGGRLPDYVVCGHDAFKPKDRQTTGDRVYFEDLLREVGLFPKRAVTARVQGWWAWKDCMRRKQWHYFDGYNGPMVEEIVAAQHDSDDPEDIIGRGNKQEISDHALDENRYGVLATYRPGKPQTVDPFAGRPQWGYERPQINVRDPRVIWGPND